MDLESVKEKSGERLLADGSKLKPQQISAIASFMKGNDIFVSLPTGYGKSLVYATLPFAFDTWKGKVLQYVEKNSYAYYIPFYRHFCKHCCLHKPSDFFDH